MVAMEITADYHQKSLQWKIKTYTMRRLPGWVALLALPILFLSGCREREEGQWVSYKPSAEGYERVALSTVPPIPTASTFVEADLEADGVPELVYLEEGQVRFEREGAVVWEGEPEWQVIDLVAGDVDDDLRQEVLLAFWKPDESGTLRSHPFIIGYRHGRYDILWGGSAVVDPIHDLDLGDVDGDGRSELVVLEGAYDQPAGTPARFVTVWRWNGWGFTLLWRSEPGRYRDLHVLDFTDNGVPEMIVWEERGER